MKRLIPVLALIFSVSLAFAQQDSVLICHGPKSYSYHAHICQGLRNCSTALEKITLGEAKKIGRTSCGNCYKVGSAAPATVSYKKTLAVSSHCAARTKKGTRCSRGVRSGGYCWQHGG